MRTKAIIKYSGLSDDSGITYCSCCGKRHWHSDVCGVAFYDGEIIECCGEYHYCNSCKLNILIK